MKKAGKIEPKSECSCETEEEKVFTQHEMNEACRIRDLQIMELTNKMYEPKSEKCVCKVSYLTPSNICCTCGKICKSGSALPEKEPRKECEHNWKCSGGGGGNKEWYFKFYKCEKCKETKEEKINNPLPEKEPRKGKGHCEIDLDDCVKPSECKWFVKNSGKENQIKETPKRIEPTNLFRTIPPDNLEQVHYAFCALADKIDELIQDRNDRVGNGQT